LRTEKPKVVTEELRLGESILVTHAPSPSSKNGDGESERRNRSRKRGAS
jgi:hypothetical protein